MKTYTKEENNRKLDAWNEWKTICSILGCSPEHRQALKGLVGNAFIKKANQAVGNPFFLKNTTDTQEEYAQEFDMGIIEKATNPGIDKRTGKERVKKNYKDYVWHKIEESSDEPLKVIHGILIGPQGIINDIVENYLVNQHGFVWTNKDGKRFLSHPDSMNASVEGKDGSATEVGDLIEILCTPPEELDDSELELIKKEVNKYTIQEAAVFLASLVRLSLADQTLLELIELEKSQAYEMNKKLLAKLQLFLSTYFIPDLRVKVLQQMKNEFFLKLATEKRATEFLSVVETKMSETK